MRSQLLEKMFFVWIAIWVGVGIGFFEKEVVVLSLVGGAAYLFFKIAVSFKTKNIKTDLGS